MAGFTMGMLYWKTVSGEETRLSRIFNIGNCAINGLLGPGADKVEGESLKLFAFSNEPDENGATLKSGFCANATIGSEIAEVIRKILK